MKDMKLPVTYHQEKDMNHFIIFEFKNIEITKATFATREGEFFTIPTVFALEGSIERNCFKME